MPLIFSAIFGSILFFILLIILETVLFFLPPEYPLIITIVLISLIPILLIKNAFFGDSWKNSILVKKANGGYEFRFRKDSAIDATWRKMAMKWVDSDEDGKVTFKEILRATGEVNIFGRLDNILYHPHITFFRSKRKNPKEYYEKNYTY